MSRSEEPGEDLPQDALRKLPEPEHTPGHEDRQADRHEPPGRLMEGDQSEHHEQRSAGDPGPRQPGRGGGGGGAGIGRLPAFDDLGR